MLSEKERTYLEDYLTLDLGELHEKYTYQYRKVLKHRIEKKIQVATIDIALYRNAKDRDNSLI